MNSAFIHLSCCRAQVSQEHFESACCRLPDLVLWPSGQMFLLSYQVLSFLSNNYVYISYEAWLLCKEEGRVVFPLQMPYQQGDWELPAQRSKSPQAEKGTEHFGWDYSTVRKDGGFQWRGFFFWPPCVTLLSSAGKRHLSERGIQSGKMHNVK